MAKKKSKQKYKKYEEEFVNTRCTIAENTYINELLKGLTQRKAYMKAFPGRCHWKPDTIDTRASHLFNTPRVKNKFNTLLAEHQEREQEQTCWTREQSILALRQVIENNKNEVERINNAADEELDEMYKMMQLYPDRADKIIMEMIKKRQKRRVYSVHNEGIIRSVAELNKMQGFNEETINMTQTVMFSGEDELED